MTSVRTCYCKHERNAARKTDNDIGMHNENRHSATSVSKKSIVTNATCGSGRESCKRARRVISEKMPNSRWVEAQPPNPVLSPETSTALENAEKIINNAKIQLMEVCATSSIDSAQRNTNLDDGEPPLDDEAEERLYVRELVASKFHDACSSRLSETNGKASARSEKRDPPRVTVRRVDLSAPKFRLSRRRRADWSSLGYRSDNRSRGRAPLARVPSRESIGVANETTARDDRARDRRRTLSARGNACEIQIGPSVHIADRELIRQDLEDVHISPEPFRAQSRANTATYTLCHDVIRNADNGINDPGISGMPRTRRVRLDTLQGKPIERDPPITEAATETVPIPPAEKLAKEPEKNSDSGQNDGRIESSKVRNYRQERKARELDPQDTERISERLEDSTSEGAAKFAMIETPRTDRSEKFNNKAGNEAHDGIAFGDDTQIRYADDGEIFCKRSGADRQRNDEDKMRTEENRGDQSKPSPGGDTSRKAGFPRQRENVASRCRQAESTRPYRTTDRHFSHTFNSHKEEDGLRDIAGEDIIQSFASDCMDVFQETLFPEDNLEEIDLYRPRLDDLDSILHFNDRKIERVARTTRDLSEFLSGPEFAMYKLDEQDAEKLCRNSDKESAGSSILETDLRNEDLMVSGIQRTDEDLQGANAAGTKSSVFTREAGFRGNYSKNSVESSVFPASDTSDSPRTSRDNDKAQRSPAKARSSESSMDVTTFSNLVPALSSTHTETQACRHRTEEEIAQKSAREDTKPRVTTASKFSKRETHRSGKEYPDDGILARLFRKDASHAADRFVAYLLQDEKRSVEGKVASALKEAAVTPAAVQKLLDYLREAESIRDARQTETLDILRNILTNVKSQSDQGNANGREASPRNVPDSPARTNAPINTIEFTRRGKLDTGKDSNELKGLGEYCSDFSECRETRESVLSTARCESTQHFENDSKRESAGQTESADVARTVSVGAENRTDKDINQNNSKEEETQSRNVTGPLIRTSATEKAILRAKNNTNDAGQFVGESNNLKNPDKRFSVSPAVPETRGSVRSAARFVAAGDSKNNSGNNSKENSCSEAESLKQISDIRSDDDEDLGGSSEHSSTKVASARSRGGREVETAHSVGAIAPSENKEDDMNTERFGGDKSNDVQADEDQGADKIVTQADQVIDGRSSVLEEAVKEITSEKPRDGVTLADKRVLFVLPEVPEIKSESTRSDASPTRSKLIEEDSAKTHVDLVHSSAEKDAEFLREANIAPQQVAIKGIGPADSNCSIDPPRDRPLPNAKSSESSLQEVSSRNKQISSAGKDNSTRDTSNEEIRKSMTLTAVENRGNEISEPWKNARNDNERQQPTEPTNLTDAPWKCKINVLSGSNSSVSSTLLDHDDRSTNGASSADARKVETTPEMSHSEGELYMPSSCSYSIGEVRVLRRKRDFVEDNSMDRDSSATVLVTRSMLTSLNDSTVPFLESPERV